MSHLLLPGLCANDLPLPLSLYLYLSFPLKDVGYLLPSRLGANDLPSQGVDRQRLPAPLSHAAHLKDKKIK